MKLTNLKWLAIAGLMLIFGAETQAQLKIRWETNVRYIAGNYIDKRPQFATLEAALNDVKAYATSDNPYVFWVQSDSLWIADWDSVFNAGSGMTMKDSIDVNYVASGKIKWAGFGQGGGGGSGTVTIITQGTTTTHYSYPNWAQTNAILMEWQRQSGKALDSIDQHIYDLIVYPDSTYLYIENDTLWFRTSSLSSFGARPDTTIIAYKGVNESITGDWDFDGDIDFDGSLRLPIANNNTGVARVVWSASNVPWWSGNGAAGDSSIFALIDPTSGTMRRDSMIAWADLQDEVQDSISLGTSPVYNEVYWYSTDPDTIPLLTGGGWLTAGDWTEGENAGVTVTTDSSITIGTSGLYQIGYTLSFTGANLQVVETGIFVDEVLAPGTGFLRKLGTGADVGNAGATCLISLTAGEVLELKLRSPGVTGDIVLHIGNWNMARVK